MPGIGGFDALTRILAKDAAAKILVLSAHEDTIHPSRVLHAGALGYLTKRGAPEELIGAIRQVANGKTELPRGSCVDVSRNGVKLWVCWLRSDSDSRATVGPPTAVTSLDASLDGKLTEPVGHNDPPDDRLCYRTNVSV